MIIEDKVYGIEEIKEPILIELINCNSLHRLKYIAQFGLPDEYYHINGFSRYEHSIGVFILLKRLNASLKEQIAGLIHDVSHTAFSHVIDWVIGDPTKEDYQDNVFLDFIKKSEIPSILEKYGFDYNDFANLEDYSLLEKNSPSLCVDRFDYTIREIKYLNGSINIKLILDDLINWKGNLAFKSKIAGKLFAEAYIKCQNEHWAGQQAKMRYHILAEILRKAINEKLIVFSDLEKYDDFVIDLLLKSGDVEILSKLKLLREGFDITKSEKGVLLNKKFRYVDPEILVNNSLVNLSKVSKDYKDILDNEWQNSKTIERLEVIPK